MIKFISLIPLVMASILAGCASTPAPNSESGVQLGASSSADAIRRRLTNTDNGLELRRWTVIEQPGRTMQALVTHNASQFIDDAIADSLKRNGFRFVRIPVDELEELAATLGIPTVDVNEWHGQVHEWRSLEDRPVDARGRAVAIDGRVQRFDRGEFQLIFRCWSAQMEDWPCIHLELLPAHHRPQANHLRRLLPGREEPAEQRSAGYQTFRSMSVDVQLQANYAYVLLSESPQIDWAGLDAHSAEGAPGQKIAKTKSHRSRYGPSDSIGPEAPPPLTMGELLLPADRDPPTRTMLVFVPKISPQLFPLEYSTTGEEAGP